MHLDSDAEQMSIRDGDDTMMLAMMLFVVTPLVENLHEFSEKIQLPTFRKTMLLFSPEIQEICHQNRL